MHWTDENFDYGGFFSLVFVGTLAFQILGSLVALLVLLGGGQGGGLEIASMKLEGAPNLSQLVLLLPLASAANALWAGLTMAFGIWSARLARRFFIALRGGSRPSQGS